MAIKTSSPDTTLKVAQTIAATRERVFKAWTEPKELMRWFAGTYREIVPPEKLVFTWAWEGGQTCSGINTTREGAVASTDSPRCSSLDPNAVVRSVEIGKEYVPRVEKTPRSAPIRWSKRFNPKTLNGPRHAAGGHQEGGLSAEK